MHEIHPAAHRLFGKSFLVLQITSLSYFTHQRIFDGCFISGPSMYTCHLLDNITGKASGNCTPLSPENFQVVSVWQQDFLGFLVLLTNGHVQTSCIKCFLPLYISFQIKPWFRFDLVAFFTVSSHATLAIMEPLLLEQLER